MGENSPGEDAGAVVVKLAAIRPEDIVIGTMLIVVLENVSCFRRPFDQLPLLKLVQRMTYGAGILRVRREQEEDVVQQVVNYKDREGACCYRTDDRSDGSAPKIVPAGC